MDIIKEYAVGIDPRDNCEKEIMIVERNGSLFQLEKKRIKRA